MQHSDMNEQNRRAITMLDDMQTEQAGQVFRDNYRRHPCVLTAFNYAVFLLDEHFGPIGLHARGWHRRRLKGRWLLAKAAAQDMDESAAYHVACMRGRTAFGRLHIRRAERLYQAALDIRRDSVEALAMLAWIAFMRGDYGRALTHFDMMSEVLGLGDDMERNEDILYDNSPIQAYYELRALARIGAASREHAIQLTDELCKECLSADEALFYPVSLTIICLGTHSYGWLGRIADCMERDDDCNFACEFNVNMAICMLIRARRKSPDAKRLRDLLRRKTSRRSKLDTVMTLLLRSRVRMLYNSVFVHYAECQFIGCPLHDGIAAEKCPQQ